MSNQNSIFSSIDPTTPLGTGSLATGSLGTINTGSICLILGGGDIDSQSVISGNSSSIASSEFYLAGVGFTLKPPYTDTLLTAELLRIPISASDGIHSLLFKVDDRTTNGSYIHLWTNDTSSNISGSWVVNGFELAANPYEEYGEDYSSLDYRCGVTGSDSILFWYYIPPAFDVAGEYNALLNNASTESNQNLYTVDVYNGASHRRKFYVADDHKVPAKGGQHAGNYIHLSAEASRYQQTKEYEEQFYRQSDHPVQTLDLAFLSYRALSASIYVDRTFEGRENASLEEIWVDLQKGDEEPTETVYFVPELELSGSYIKTGVRSTVPVSGSILFKVDKTRIVRHTNATLYAPFMNTVFRTDEFGVVTGFYPSGS